MPRWKTWPNCMEARDQYLRGHSSRVRDVATQLAERMGLAPRECEQLGLVAMFHNIGNLGISPEVLQKPEQLSPEEREQVQQHTIIGYDIVSAAEMLPREYRQIVRHHHEHMDGSGYPDGLSGEAIPLVVRLVCIAEAIVAMFSDRPYRKALSPEIIMAELRKKSGTQFDPVLSEKATELIHSGALL